MSCRGGGGVGGGPAEDIGRAVLAVAELLLLAILPRPPLTRAANVLISSAVSILSRAFKQVSAVTRLRST